MWVIPQGFNEDDKKEEWQMNAKDRSSKVSRASKGMIDLSDTGGASPPRKQSASKRAAKCRIRVVAVSCAEASDAVRRLERIAALLIGKVSPDA